MRLEYCDCARCVDLEALEHPLTEATVQALVDRVERGMKAFRRRSPLTSLGAPAGVFFTATRWQSRPYAQPMVWLATSGCSHVVEHGGCTMCDFGCGDYSREETIDGLGRVLDRLDSAPLLHLAAPGSFLDDAEVPAETRDQMLAEVSTRGVVALGIEARPEYIRVESLSTAVQSIKAAGGSSFAELCIGTGVEAFDDSVARVCINKGSTRAAALAALKNIRRADAQFDGVDVLAEAHVLLRPPALTEAEAIDDATATIEWCLAEGFERAILMLCSAKPQSPLAMLAVTEAPSAPGADYRPASLWSALEVLSRLPRSMRARVRVHGFASNTPIGLRPTTCPACEQAVVAAIQHFNFTDSDEGLDAVRRLGCECRDRWEADCAREPEASLSVRMHGFVDALERASEGG